LLWLENYFKELNNKSVHIIQIKLEYFNSSSAKYLLTILKKLSHFYQNGTDIKVHWFYETDDEDMKEAGEQMSDIIKMPFKFFESNDLK